MPDEGRIILGGSPSDPDLPFERIFREDEDTE